jgi:hypothetical protein
MQDNPSNHSVEPIRSVRFLPSANDPLLVTVVINLADHIASCCITPETTFVEFLGEKGRTRSGFVLKEHRPGHQMIATLGLPASGVYRYRNVAKILAQPFFREGIYSTS